MQIKHLAQCLLHSKWNTYGRSCDCCCCSVLRWLCCTWWISTVVYHQIISYTDPLWNLLAQAPCPWSVLKSDALPKNFVNSCGIYFHGYLCSEFCGAEPHVLSTPSFFFLPSMPTQPWNSLHFLWFTWQKHWEISVYSRIYWRCGSERGSLPQNEHLYLILP